MSDLSAIVSRLESVTSRLENLASSGTKPSDAVDLQSYDEKIGEALKNHLNLSKKNGGEVAEQSKLTEGAFNELRKIVENASKYQCPPPKQLKEIVKPLSSKVDEVVAFAEKNRASKVFNYLMTIKEGIGCVGWVTISPKPAPYIKECKDQALFYGNRVIKDDKAQKGWVNSYTNLIQALYDYVKAEHTTGLVWNQKGPVMPATAAAPAAAAPPPPPPPAIQPPDDVAGGKTSGATDTNTQRANLFASLNKGGQVTQGLRKVTDDMKTHKNPELRASSIIKAGEGKPASKASPKYGAANTANKPPVLALQGKKWVVEYQDNKPDLAITETNPKQTVYVYKCTKSTLKVAGKVNSIILDNCKRMALCFDDVISSAEVVNCQGVQVQVINRCPTVSIDKTDGCLIFLSKDSLNCEIVSAKSSEMNVAIPPKDGEGDFTERPIPEQFKTTVKGTSLVTEATDITS